MTVCLIALGSNLGDRVASLQQAVRLLDQHPDIHCLALSSWFRSPPIGGPAGQGEFVNAVVRVETTRSPHALLHAMREVESELGRERRTRWAARTVDLDLLLYGQRILRTRELRLPHPRMAFRRFVLEPAAEVGAELMHPEIGWTMAQLLAHLNAVANYFAITGPPGSGKTTLAERTTAATGAILIRDPFHETTSPEARSRWSPEQETVLARQRAQVLQPFAASRETRPHLSDFWIGQSFAYAARAAGADGVAALQRHWKQEAPSGHTPKLLVCLGCGATDPDEHEGETAEGSVSWREALRVGYVGPVLELAAQSLDQNLVELRAALEAMR